MNPKIPNILTPDNLTTIRGKQITTWLFISRTKPGADRLFGVYLKTAAQTGKRLKDAEVLIQWAQVIVYHPHT